MTAIGGKGERRKGEEERQFVQMKTNYKLILTLNVYKLFANVRRERVGSGVASNNT